ncbi:putative F-actin capping protein beta subunit [Cantharellus anzutake]|uniref:putative F-actin capping protein beta subunit n=1 Tax=Cantharellus anzutake TaxID=1750568 RepID=UPI0019041BCB|nr:putative F-actin capping protein beta subunit [Cantharellus anzutake]KAF8340318.1 putative F-actin capping protein beta subunit [Cantharellus anzutake]
MSEMDLLDNMLDLARRLPPANIEQTVASLVELCPEYADELLGSVDQPLQILTDAATGREYLICDYNRDGESYRSPWSNEYDPPLDDATYPSAKIRKLEIAANDAFDTYREMYFEGGVSSVFLWDLDDGGFAGVVLLKKTLNSEKGVTGSWDSIHVFEASERGPEKGKVELSGSMTRQIEQDAPLTDASSHISNTGRMVEDHELKMRNLLQEVYFGKTKDVVYDLRSIDSLEKARRQRELQKELAGLLKR